MARCTKGGDGQARRLRRLIASCPPSRLELWGKFLDEVGAERVAEIGVLGGVFAEAILGHCDRIERYWMVDPWRHLDGWNKPANVSDEEFESFYAQALRRTEPWREKRVALRGTTSEVIDRIEDGTLDFLYIDGDHTLRGIAIDLIKAYPKVRAGGYIAGDDFCPSIWQHVATYEPTLVFPFAAHFAEAMDLPIFALPHDQFLIEKRPGARFEFRDLVGAFGDRDLGSQVRPRSE